MLSRAIFTSFKWTRNYSSKSTIFGLSSGTGKCGVAVIRISGDASGDVVKRKTSASGLPEARRATLRRIFHSQSAEMIDKGLVLWFPGPHSFTGEDCAEFHVHGGAAVISAMYDSLGAIEGVRLAEPGEFTKRAFYAGKMDLTEVEGLADLIDAETEAQRRQALLQANGELSKLYDGMRGSLLKCIAHVEAYIDFAEDQDVDDGVLRGVSEEVDRLVGVIRAHLDDRRRGERLRTGVRTAIVGAPNVGKSSFANLLSNRKVSIVTSVAGTTRDIVESHHDIGGYPVILADTAGLRSDTKDMVEMEGISRAKEYVQLADFIIVMVDSGELQKYLEVGKGSFAQYLDTYLEQLGFNRELLSKTRAMLIVNKVDLIPNDTLQSIGKTSEVKFLSCHTRTGVEEVLDEITVNLKHLCGNPSKESPVLSQQRHRYHLKQCVQYLEKYSTYLEEERHPDLAIATQHLRNATRSIGKITGAIETEEILDVIFRSFCIGK